MRTRFGAMLLGLLATAQLGAADAVFARFEANLKSLKGLTAAFTQEVEGLFGLDQAAGRLWLARPDRLRWAYEQPEPQLFLLVGRRYQHYHPAERQLVIRELDPDELDASPLAFLLGSGPPLSARYRVEPLPPSPDGYTYRLFPLDPDSPFVGIELELGGEPLFPRQALLYETGGTRHRYRFDDIRFEAALPDRLFQFQPPPGTEVIGLE